MAAIVEWSYYSSLYSKVKNETEFSKLETLAENEVKSVIGPIRWAEIDSDTFGYTELKDCICKVVDFMVDTKDQGSGVSSVNNDGYSETFTLITQSDVKNEMQKSIRQWLSGTGLVRAY